MLPNMRISRKLMIGFAVVTSASLIMVLVIGVTIMTLSSAVQNSGAANLVVTSLNKVTEQMYRADRALLGFALSNDPRYTAAAEDGLKQISVNLEDAERLLPQDKLDLLRQIKVAHSAVDRWLNEFGMPRFRDMQLPDGRARIELSFVAGRNATTDTLHALQDVQQVTATWSQNEEAEERRTMHVLVMTLIIGTLVGTVLSIGAGYSITKSITVPLGGMVTAIGALAGGDIGVEIPALRRQDEIGDVGRAVQVLKTGAIEKRRLEQEAADALHSAAESRLRSDAEQAERTLTQAAVVGGLAAGLSALAAGNLAHRLNQPFAPDYDSLRQDFNTAAATLDETMQTVAGTTQAIRSGSMELAGASDDLAHRTERQAASLEQTAAALDQITATVKQTAEGSAHARAVVEVARGDAQQSGEIVAQAMQAMHNIEASSNQISQITSVIDEIAFQTNLLALNAGVEAARAGDAGRGFAVVASEVRALAQRSAAAAKEIKSLISASHGQVKIGVDLVGATGTSLTRILLQVTEISGVVAAIAASAKEQAIGLAEVNTAANQIDQVTQQNAAMVEESTAAAHNLVTETDRLTTLLQRFQVGDASGKAARVAPGKTPKLSKSASLPSGRVRMAANATAAWQEF